MVTGREITDTNRIRGLLVNVRFFCLFRSVTRPSPLFCLPDHSKRKVAWACSLFPLAAQRLSICSM